MTRRARELLAESAVFLAAGENTSESNECVKLLFSGQGGTRSDEVARPFSLGELMPDLVKILPGPGASRSIEGEPHHAPRPLWFDHGVRRYPEETGKYPDVAQLLLAAVTAIPTDEPAGNAEVDALLRRRGLMR